MHEETPESNNMDEEAIIQEVILETFTASKNPLEYAYLMGPLNFKKNFWTKINKTNSDEEFYFKVVFQSFAEFWTDFWTGMQKYEVKRHLE